MHIFSCWLAGSENERLRGVLGDCLLAAIVKNTWFPYFFSGFFISFLEITCSQFHLIIFHELVLNVKNILLGRSVGLVRSDFVSVLQTWRVSLLSGLICCSYFLSVHCLLTVDVRFLGIPAKLTEVPSCNSGTPGIYVIFCTYSVFLLFTCSVSSMKWISFILSN